MRGFGMQFLPTNTLFLDDWTYRVRRT